jgi:hypothetical protein
MNDGTTAAARRPSRRPAVLAREHAASYDRTVRPDHAGTADPAPSLRDAVRRVRGEVERVLALAADPRIEGGELGALLDLLGALDLGHAAAVELTDRSLAAGLAERSASLPFDGLLALSSRATYGERGRLQRHARLLRTMPHLRAAVRAGQVGSAQLAAIAEEVRRIPAERRHELDRWFSDDRWLAQDPDRIVDLVREQADRLRPDLAEAREVRAVQGNRLALQPALDGTGTGWFAYDADSYARLAAALEAAAVPPSADIGDDPSADGRVPSRQQELADALVGIADHYLAGDGGVRLPSAAPAVTVDRRAVADRWDRWAGRAGRARTATTVVVDIAQLVAPDDQGRAARQLWRTFGRPPALTAAGVERLTSDTDLAFLLVDGHTILGTTAPTPSIPVAVRRVVHARDQGCRFPGCRAPAAWTDLHHVVARHEGGPTTVDNLVALCRRHHTLVTTRRWRLDLDPDGTVTVRRGRRRHTSRPPLHDHLDPPDPPPPVVRPARPDHRGCGSDPPERGAATSPPRLPDPSLPF